MPHITTFEQLDRYLAEAEALPCDDEKRRAWATLQADPRLWEDYPARLSGTDAFSSEYESIVNRFIDHIRGRDYQLADEVLDVDIERLSVTPFPYVTASPETVGGFLIAYGHIISVLNLPVPARILDIGSGAGSLTIHLARMGYDMTCVDVNPQFIELLRRMTARLPKPPELLCGDMNSIDLNGTYDAILFFESFHHSRDPAGSLRRLRRHLNASGCFAFAAEPIVDEPCDVVPYPWGPRLDGETLRAIRRFGWIEWGFTWPYFRELLAREGLTAQRYRNPSSHWADVVIARAPILLEEGQQLDFSAKGQGVQCLNTGWSHPEDFGTWSCEDVADLQFGLGSLPQDAPLTLTMELTVFLAAGSERREVELSLNGQPAGTWVFEGRSPVRVERAVLVRSGIIEPAQPVTVSFRITSPVTPKELGLSSDPRRIGVALSSITVTVGRRSRGLAAAPNRLLGE